MKLKKIDLSNFKCFKQAQIEFGKITVLTGANSSGKSSVLYGLLGPLQSDVFPFKFSLNGNYVNMGDYPNVSYKHLKKPIVINFEFEVEETVFKINTEWGQDSTRPIPTLLELRVDAGYFFLEIKRKDGYDITWNYDKSKDPNSEKYGTEFYKKITELIREFSGDGAIPDEYFTEPSPKKEVHVKDLNDILNGLGSQALDIFMFKEVTNVINLFDRFDSNSNFISSFRLSPDRTYYEKSVSDLKVKKNGLNYIDQILIWESENKEKYRQLQTALNELGILKSIKPKRLEGGRFEIQVKVDSKSVSSSLNDIGFGVSQVLPILVADLQMEDESTLFVAQPEIHLHPKVQALLADYFIDKAINSNKKYVLETHSEYIIHRIRLAIVKKQLQEDDVRSYYFKNDGQETTTHPLIFKKSGKIEGAPRDFFETYMMDVMDIAISSVDG